MKIGKWTILFFDNSRYSFIPKIVYRNSQIGTRFSVSIFLLKYCLRIDYWKRKYFWNSDKEVDIKDFVEKMKKLNNHD